MRKMTKKELRDFRMKKKRKINWKINLDLPVLMVEIPFLILIVFLIFNYYGWSFEYLFIGFCAFFIIGYRMIQYKESGDNKK